MKRGDIYYISRRDTIGAETMKARPAVIISNNALNETSEVIEVAYLTTQPKKDLPTHVVIRSTGRPSTVLCEHIDHISTLLVGDYCGTCTEEEMRAIDAALLASLGIREQKKTKSHDAVNSPSHYAAGSIEVIDFIEALGLNFRLGNVIKYIARAGKKDPSKTVEDLKKALYYLQREVNYLENE